MPITRNNNRHGGKPPRRSAVGLVMFAVCSAAFGQDGQSTRVLDESIRAGLIDVVKAGVRTYSAGDHQGCYRTYEGALRALRPLLGHRPEMQTALSQGLSRAEALNTPVARAFALRDLIGEVYEDLARPMEAQKSTQKLWDRLGGAPEVNRIVKDFVERTLANNKVNFTREGAFSLTPEKKSALEQRLVEWVSTVTGGPLVYRGRAMGPVHQEMKITDAEFEACVDDLRAVLGKNFVPESEAQELLGIIAKTKPDLVLPNIPARKQPLKPAPSAKLPPPPPDPFPSAEPPSPPKPLWERLGGLDPVKAVVRDFVKAAVADKEVNFDRGGKFDLTPEKIKALEERLLEMISAATGGPLRYTGKDMKSTHQGMKITAGEFAALKGHLVKVLAKYRVPQREVDELVTIIANTQNDIVE